MKNSSSDDFGSIFRMRQWVFTQRDLETRRKYVQTKKPHNPMDILTNVKIIMRYSVYTDYDEC